MTGVAHAYRTGSWSWSSGNGMGTGEVVEVHAEKVTQTLKGSEATRNGSDECPAYLEEQSDGTQVLKLESELENA